MTMKILAKLSGVSVSTVSKAFSGSKEISAHQREHIFQTAKENGCYEKYYKPRFEKPVIAVICPEFQSGYYSQHLMLLEQEIKKRGGMMLVSCTNFDEQTHAEQIKYFAEYIKVSGIIVYKIESSIDKYNTPIVVIGNDDMFDSISLSGENAMFEAIKHFADNGHKSIAFIGEKLTASKRQSFALAIEKNNLQTKQEYIIETKERFEPSGYKAMNYLLSLPAPPTAVLAAYDNIAFGAMKSIFEHGLKIPDDISIIGMDDNKENPYLSVPLTSITSYNKDLCEIIVDTLFDRIENGYNDKSVKINLSTELIKRGSVGKAKH